MSIYNIIRERLIKAYAKYIYNKGCLNKLVFNNNIGTLFVYLDILPILVNKGFNYLIEIGTGSYSTPAISIKMLRILNNIEFYGIDINNEIVYKLNNLLERIDLPKNAYCESFFNLNSFFEIHQQRGIICFEHSIEDILIKMIAEKYGFYENNSWDNILLQCDKLKMEDNNEIVSYFLECIIDKICEYIYNYHNIAIIHHYISPLFDKKSFLNLLDRKVLDKLDYYGKIKDINFMHVRFQPNYIGEQYLMGGL